MIMVGGTSHLGEGRGPRRTHSSFLAEEPIRVSNSIPPGSVSMMLAVNTDFRSICLHKI